MRTADYESERVDIGISLDVEKDDAPLQVEALAAHVASLLCVEEKKIRAKNKERKNEEYSGSPI